MTQLPVRQTFTEAEARQMIGALRQWFPDGELSDIAAAEYARLLAKHDPHSVVEALQQIREERQSRRFPPWAEIQAALADYPTEKPKSDCPWCQDTGWVTLTGSTTIHGVTYERGVTACRWCTTGEEVYESVTTPRRHKGGYWPGVEVASDYQAVEVEDTHHTGERMTLGEYVASEAGKRDAALADPAVRAMLGVAS